MEIFSPNGNIITYEINDIYDEEDNLIDIVRHPKQIVKIKINETLHKYDLIRVKRY